MSRDVRVSDRIYPSVQAMQPPRAQAMLNGAPAESQLHELLMCHDTVLPLCEAGDLSVAWSNFRPYIEHFFDRVAHGRMIPSHYARDSTRMQRNRAAHCPEGWSRR
jgi:hypothetical protein